MKLFGNKKRFGYIWKVAGAVIIVIIISCSITITGVVQPASVNGGQTLDVTLNANISTNTSQTSNLMVAVLVPKIWNAAANATVTFTSDISSGNQAMTVIPNSTPAPGANGLNWPTDLLNTIGHAGNLIQEYEWVAFYSNTAYAIGGNVSVNVVVNIQINVGQANVLFNMAYVVGESGDGLHSTAWGDPSTSYYGTYFPGALRVYGTGTLLDFINPQLSVITPSTALDNDIITIPFGADVINNGLTGASQIYLCATGYVHGGDSIVVCQQNAQSQLDSLGQGNFQIDMWPRGFFNLTSTQTLDSIHYVFTDASGTIKVGNEGTLTPFSFGFNCQ
jgi:hypothetical protein